MFNIFKRKIERIAGIERKTTETEINCILNIDGKGKAQIDTGIGFLDHMLELFVFHGLLDLKLKVIKSDLKVDTHHTNEDVGIVLGQTFKKALGNMKGIRRFGSASAPMESVLASVTLDISGRSHFTGIISRFGLETAKKEEDYTIEDANHFFESFAKQSGVNIIIKTENPGQLAPGMVDIHTALEPVFKAFGIALNQATGIDPHRQGIPSTKGVID